MSLSCLVAAPFESSQAGAVAGKALVPFSRTKHLGAYNKTAHKSTPKTLSFSQLDASENNPGTLAKTMNSSNAAVSVRVKFPKSPSTGISLRFNVELIQWPSREN
jgi:hypothetical protein